MSDEIRGIEITTCQATKPLEEMSVDPVDPTGLALNLADTPGDAVIPEVLERRGMSGIGITASNVQASHFVFQAGGVEIIKLTQELGQGKITVSDEHMKFLLDRNPQAANGAFAIMNAVKDEIMIMDLRTALNNFFVGLLNEFHRDLAERASKIGK